MTLPKIRREAIRSICILVQGDVIRAFELDDEVPFGFVFVISSGLGVLEEGQSQLLTCRPEGFDIFDLCFDFGEVTQFFLLVDG